ncbi:hypothetical protein QJQ45_004039 [Haematococcus lacustris]|nr:hypothetical protein QJQ45_004039 [Haematococcus lacustris]
MQRNRQLKRNRNASDIEVDREVEAQPEPSQAQKNKKASGEAHKDRHDIGYATWHAKKAKRHTVMRGVCAAGLEAGLVVASEVVEARVVTQLEAWVEACSMRALLGSLLLGLAVRGWFTRVRVLPDGQEVFEEIPAELAVIPNLADRNMYLQLIRGLPPPSRRSQPSAAVEDVLAFYPGLDDRLKALEKDMAEVSMKRHGRAKQLVVFFGAASIGTQGGPRKPPQSPRSSQEATQPAASEPGLSTPLPAKRSKRTKAEQAAEPTKDKGKAAKAKPAPQPGRWLDRDCNAALNMQRIGESRWRPLELCWWPEQGALPAKGKEYPGLGYKRVQDQPPKTQPAVAQ